MLHNKTTPLSEIVSCVVRKHGSKPTGSIKCGEFLDWPRNISFSRTVVIYAVGWWVRWLVGLAWFGQLVSYSFLIWAAGWNSVRVWKILWQSISTQSHSYAWQFSVTEHSVNNYILITNLMHQLLFKTPYRYLPPTVSSHSSCVPTGHHNLS